MADSAFRTNWYPNLVSGLLSFVVAAVIGQYFGLSFDASIMTAFGIIAALTLLTYPDLPKRTYRTIVFINARDRATFNLSFWAILGVMTACTLLAEVTHEYVIRHQWRSLAADIETTSDNNERAESILLSSLGLTTSVQAELDYRRRLAADAVNYFKLYGPRISVACDTLSSYGFLENKRSDDAAVMFC